MLVFRSGCHGTGTWTTANTWRDGSSTGTLGNWVDDNNAVFAGTAGTVTLGGSVSVSRLTFNTAAYTIGQTANATHAISFSGSFDADNPAIAGTSNATTINAKITGMIGGGLFIGQSAVTPPNLQRFALFNANNDFTGDIHVLNGNLAISGTNTGYGNAANKIDDNGLLAGSGIGLVVAPGNTVAPVITDSTGTGGARCAST